MNSSTCFLETTCYNLGWIQWDEQLGKEVEVFGFSWSGKCLENAPVFSKLWKANSDPTCFCWYAILHSFVAWWCSDDWPVQRKQSRFSHWLHFWPSGIFHCPAQVGWCTVSLSSVMSALLLKCQLIFIFRQIIDYSQECFSFCLYCLHRKTNRAK